MTITTAMVLAAGLGSRLRPLTETTPKPLIEVGGKPVILRTLQALACRGFTKAVVNVHYKPKMICDYVQANAPLEVVFSQEDVLLETGGGLKHALPHLGDDPFLVINADAVWLEEKHPLLKELCAAFDPARMEALLAVVPYARTQTFRQQQGDFALAESGALSWPANRDEAGWVHSGIHVTQPDFIAQAPETIFSLAALWRDAAAVKRLHGFAYDAPWVDMGNHAGLLAAQELLA